MSLAPGTQLGRYTIVELLAIGGMGEVYRATDASLNRDVAVKILPDHLAADRDSLERFRREARAVASLSHPNVLAIYDFGSDRGVDYAVTELLEGETLRARLLRGRMAPREAIGLIAELCDGVAAAHARGIIHRDLKPENLFLTSSGRAKVLDFGLARLMAAPEPAESDASPTAALPTAPGTILGTVGYLAPEQIEGRTLGPATDVFALGCILYEVLTGRLPFAASSHMRLLLATLSDEAAPMAVDDSLAKAAEPIISRCLEKSPAERYPTAGELAADLRALLATGVSTRFLSSTLRQRRAHGSRRMLAAVMSIVALLALLTWWFVVPIFTVIDAGYDVRASDIRADRSTRNLVALALRADADGNRPKAVALLEEASRRPSPTAIPAAFLSSYAGASGDDARAQQWATTARKRAAEADPYESLLVEFLTRRDSDEGRSLALAKSLLTLRPQAWRLRLASAHVQLARRQPAAALAELRQIDVRKPDDSRLGIVLADRASLGDTAGAARDLRASRLGARPPLFHYCEGRIAWSRGEAARARDLFERAADEAVGENLLTLEMQSRTLAALARMSLHDWAGASPMLGAVAARARGAHQPESAFLAEALLAYVAHRSGDLEERDRRMLATRQWDVHPGYVAALYVLAIRLRSPVWAQWPRPNTSKEASLSGVDSLIEARVRWSRGDAAGAVRSLQHARSDGIDNTGFREEAELLARDLGLPHVRLKADPPYPNLLRWLAIFDLQR